MSGSEDSDNAPPVIKAEFSRPVDVTRLGKGGRHFEFNATDGERTALARRYSVVSVDRLEAQCDVVPVRKGYFRLTAVLRAEAVQLCVLSLEAVMEEISTEFTLLLQQTSAQQHQEATVTDFAPDEEDIEYLSSDIVDAGEIIAQYLSLEINPYPRKQGAAELKTSQKIIREEYPHALIEKDNPFELLKSLKH